MTKKYVIASRIVVILSIVFLLARCESNTRPAAGPAADLTDLAQLKQVFNRDQGRVRLVALLSPV